MAEEKKNAGYKIIKVGIYPGKKFYECNKHNTKWLVGGRITECPICRDERDMPRFLKPRK